MATNNAINSNMPIGVEDGGTGLTSITDHAVMVGSGTASITPLGVATDSQHNISTK